MRARPVTAAAAARSTAAAAALPAAAASSPALAAARDSREEEEDEAGLWERFRCWVTARGADVTAVTLARPSGVRGLVATRDIAEGESIIELPLGGCIELSDAKTAKDPSAPALELLRLCREGAGDLAPYFDLVPPNGSPDMVTMPDFFTKEELDMLQCPTAVAKTQRRQQLCDSRAAEHGLPAEDVRWALCTVAQRSFTVLSPIDGLLRLLLPGIDLINHDAEALHRFRVKWTLSPMHDGLFKVVAGSDVKEGEEVRICYGGSPFRPDGCGGDCSGDIAWTNEGYLNRYGFIDTCLGTTMVDGKWLVSEAADPVREALARTAAADDEALLAGGGLTPAARTAVEFRLHLKRALAAQQAAEAIEARGGRSGSPAARDG